MTGRADPALVAAVAVASAELASFAGLEVAALGPRAVDRAVERRIAATGLAPEAWAARLAADPVERAALTDAVVVPETMLFRDLSPFEALRAMAAARAEAPVRRRATEPPGLRVLSAACSTGDEAYSAAIALLAGGLPPARARVVGLDLSRASLAIAASGVLPRSALRGPIPEWAERFLERRMDGRVAIAPAPRGIVELRPANVLDEATAGPYDAILCRNLIIYLTAPARARVAGWLASQLAVGAPVFVGHAEVAVLLDAGWRRSPEHGPYALMPAPVPGAAAGPSPRAAATPTRLPDPWAAVGPPITAAPATAAAATGAAGPRPVASSTARDPVLAERGGDVRDATRLAESGDREGAVALLAARVAADPDDVEALALLGVLHATAGRPAAAREALRRALYLDPDHAESRAQLTLLDRAAAAGSGPG